MLSTQPQVDPFHYSSRISPFSLVSAIVGCAAFNPSGSEPVSLRARSCRT